MSGFATLLEGGGGERKYYIIKLITVANVKQIKEWVIPILMVNYQSLLRQLILEVLSAQFHDP